MSDNAKNSSNDCCASALSPLTSVLCLAYPPEFLDRFRVDSGTGCWLWVGALFSGTGYGSFNRPRRHWRAHRFSWTVAKGPIPKGLHVLHHCDTPRCVNPEHLFLGTAKDNHQDKARKGRHPKQQITACPRGHEYTFPNTYYDRNGHRHCRTCKHMAPAEPWMPIEFGSYANDRYAKLLASRRRDA